MTLDELAEKLENRRLSVDERIRLFTNNVSQISGITPKDLTWLGEIFLDTISPVVMKNLKGKIDGFLIKVDEMKNIASNN